MKSNDKYGCLYMVATPIGNLEDISARALSVLRRVDLVVCENTRNSQKLLNHYFISPASLAKITDHQGEYELKKHIDKLLLGQDIAYISDAGTPCVSDPGRFLALMAHENNIKVIAIPGASSISAALSVSGFCASSYDFVGFLSNKRGVRLKQLHALALNEKTMVFFESPHRVLPTSKDMVEVFGQERMVCVCKELTKRYELSLRLTCGEMLSYFAEKESIKGEYVIIVQGVEKSITGLEDHDQVVVLELVRALRKEGVSLVRAKSIISSCTSLRKNEIYSICLKEYNN